VKIIFQAPTVTVARILYHRRVNSTVGHTSLMNRTTCLANGLISLLALAATATAQSMDAELTKLRQLLDVQSSTEIVPSTASLPANSPIRVFLAVGPDPKIQNTFTNRIAEWNKKDGLKYGRVKLVSNLSDADVILARYEVRLNDMPAPPSSMPLVAMRSYSYLIVRKPDKLEMLWRRVIEGYSDVSDKNRIGDVLRSEFFKRMKARRKP